MVYLVYRHARQGERLVRILAAVSVAADRGFNHRNQLT
ncbi:hypothetical protein SF83666_c27270 [Sinorhizobium fredii CCBAU 83666]|nr:hypothetical protein SF83666_c27270 [Sinorhizobium fredii CCBAU 83666]